MQIQEAFDPVFPDEQTDSEREELNALWPVIGTATNHLEVFKACFDFIRTGGLVPNLRYVLGTSLSSQGISETYSFRLTVEFDEATLLQEVGNLKTSYLVNFQAITEQEDVQTRHDTIESINAEFDRLIQQQESLLRNSLGFDIQQPLEIGFFQFAFVWPKLADWILGIDQPSTDYLWFTPERAADLTHRWNLLNTLLKYARLLNSENDAFETNDPPLSFKKSLMHEIENDALANDAFKAIPHEYLKPDKFRFGIIQFFLDYPDQLGSDNTNQLLRIVIGHYTFNGGDLAKVLYPAWERWKAETLERYSLHLLYYGRRIDAHLESEQKQAQILENMLEKSEHLLLRLGVRFKQEKADQWQLLDGFRTVFQFHLPDYASFDKHGSWNTNLMSTTIRPVFVKSHSFIELTWAAPYFEIPVKDKTKKKQSTKRKVTRNERVGILEDSLHWFYLEATKSVVPFWWDDPFRFYGFDFEARKYRLWDDDSSDWGPPNGSINEIVKLGADPDFASNFSFGRNWKVIYPIQLESPSFHANLMSHKSGDRFQGIGRADTIIDEEYFWTHNGEFPLHWGLVNSPSDNFGLGKLLGLFIGLDPEKYLHPGEVFRRHHFQAFGKITRVHVTIGNHTYVRSNLPLPPHELQVKTIIDDPGTLSVLKAFQFHYYRKIDTNCNVVKLCQKNKPRDIAPEPPIDFQIPLNYMAIHGIRETGWKWLIGKQMKGDPLQRPLEDPRENAGTVMKKFLMHTSGSLSATRYSNDFFERNTTAQEVWGQIKRRPSFPLITDQEWCHLHGNAFGGESKGENFVSGSKHCNTEQLAMETGQSRVIRRNDQTRFELRTTAYLFNPKNPPSRTSVSEPPRKKRRLMIETAEDILRRVQKEERRKRYHKPDIPIEEPVAAFIRYKILQRPAASFSAEPTKVFDYTFEAQSELFDRNQFHIIEYMTRFILAGSSAFEQWFREHLIRYNLEQQNNL